MEIELQSRVVTSLSLSRGCYISKSIISLTGGRGAGVAVAVARGSIQTRPWGGTDSKKGPGLESTNGSGRELEVGRLGGVAALAPEMDDGKAVPGGRVAATSVIVAATGAAT
jgi:hypothetical protein